MVTLTDDKHIFAAYANMAQHNLEMTINHIAKSLGYKNNPDKDDPDKWGWQAIERLLSEGKDPIKKAKFYELLPKHFPFIAPMVESLRSRRQKKGIESPIDKSGDMKSVFEISKQILDFYRNYTTHFAPVEDEDKEDEKEDRLTDPCLTSTWIISIREVKARFPYAPEAMRFIEQKGKDGSKYRYCLWKERRGARGRIFSKRGLIFFLALFLEKRYIKEMLDKLKNSFYTFDDLRTPLRLNIIFETMAIYRIRLPRMRYESKLPATALAFDMLNELQRCPKEMIDTLSPADQQLFYTETEGDEDNPQSVLMKRYSDRFPTLALKYIDQQKAFGTIRFQIDLGNYHFAFYDKQCVDGNSQVRSLVKPLHGFGRINAIEEERRLQWNDIIRFFDDSAPITGETAPYVTDHYASYIINNNKVGMFWLQGRPSESLTRVGKEGTFLPALPSDPKSKELREKKKSGEQIVRLTPPRCFLSTYELPSLIFYHLLRKRLDADKAEKWLSAENIIKTTTNAYISFWQGIIDGSINADNASAKLAGLNLSTADLPKKMQQYLDGTAEEDVLRRSRLLRGRLDELIKDTENLIKRHERTMERIGSDLNKRGKRGFREIKLGRYGAWLAKDMMIMQPVPTDGSHKLTSLNFRVLQASLSVYESADSVRRVLTSANLLSGDFRHPFLAKVFTGNNDNVVKFYSHYLKEKLAWLRAIPANADLRQFHFLARGKNKWADRDDAYFRQLAQYYLDLPVELPRGLFAKPIKDLLTALFGADFIKGDKRDDANVSFLIDKYLRTKLHDDSQPFYTQRDGSFPRCYRFFALLRGGEKKNPQPLSIAEIDKFVKNEPSLWMIKEGQKTDATIAATPNPALVKMAEQVRLKLEKAKAKNPSLDVEARIVDIIQSSPSMATLSDAGREQIAAMVQGRAFAKRKGEIERHLEAIRNKEERETERLRLARSFRDMTENEKQLRRHRINDIITFLMAKDILVADDTILLGEKISNLDALKLSNVKPIGVEEAKSILEIMVPFRIKLKLKGGNEVVINQDSIKLKNYGDFLRYLHESRLETLIPYLTDDDNAVKITLDRDQLDHELENYDAQRAEVYKNVHRIEKLILVECNDLRHATFKYNDSKDNDEKSSPVANNFNELLSRFQQRFPDKIDEDVKNEMINIRNSFSHNAYMSDKGVKVGIDTKELGKIAPKIAEKLDRNVKKAENKK